jgi:hypothetical protein
MKKLLLLLLVSNSVWASSFEMKKPVICDKTEIVLKINPSTKSWTIVQFNNDVACVIGTGESYAILGKKPNT